MPAGSRAIQRLAAALPGVDLHYAIKSLPHPSVIAALRDAGGSFDLATNGEVELVRRLGVDPQRCIHTHPIKRDGDIRTALAYGVNASSSTIRMSCESSKNSRTALRC
jgi:ornithine decarboxylase